MRGKSARILPQRWTSGTRRRVLLGKTPRVSCSRIADGNQASRWKSPSFGGGARHQDVRGKFHVGIVIAREPVLRVLRLPLSEQVAEAIGKFFRRAPEVEPPSWSPGIFDLDARVLPELQFVTAAGSLIDLGRISKSAVSPSTRTAFTSRSAASSSTAEMGAPAGVILCVTLPGCSFDQNLARISSFMCVIKNGWSRPYLVG